MLLINENDNETQNCHLVCYHETDGRDGYKDGLQAPLMDLYVLK
jgi:hypothetical protein